MKRVNTELFYLLICMLRISSNKQQKRPLFSSLLCALKSLTRLCSHTPREGTKSCQPLSHKRVRFQYRLNAHRSARDILLWELTYSTRLKPWDSRKETPTAPSRGIYGVYFLLDDAPPSFRLNITRREASILHCRC